MKNNVILFYNYFNDLYVESTITFYFNCKAKLLCKVIVVQSAGVRKFRNSTTFYIRNILKIKWMVFLPQGGATNSGPNFHFQCVTRASIRPTICRPILCFQSPSLLAAYGRKSWEFFAKIGYLSYIVIFSPLFYMMIQKFLTLRRVISAIWHLK